MFVIEEYKKEIECKTLKHSINVFHEALNDGGRYYHVIGDGDIKYDISYKGNTEWYEDIVPPYIGKALPEYIEYNEYDKEGIDLTLAGLFSKYIITYLTEYSIAIARVALDYTNSHIFFMDPRAKWFFEKNDRVHIGEEPDDDKDSLYLTSPSGIRTEKMNNAANSRGDVVIFHNLFFLQYILDGRKMEQIKYLEYPLANSFLGIGGILTHTSRIIAFAEMFGWEVAYNGGSIGKYKIEELNDYYKLDFKKIDSNEQNTVKIDSIINLVAHWRYGRLPGFISENILQEKFLDDLEEYAEAIILKKKTLGVLIRGTDYKKAGFSNGILSQASVEEMSQIIQEWIDTYGYERIFLATEDNDVLFSMRKLFGDKVVVIPQERHSASEFKQGQIINDLEKQIYTEAEYDARVMDTTINYYYALYLLSKCDAFICSGQNNGWDTVIAMNNGKFVRTYKFGNAISLSELVQAQ